MVMFWVLLLAISILLYVLLDGVDLGVGMLFGLTNGEVRRSAMLSAVAPIWDGNETWLVVTAVILWGAFPAVYATLLSAFYLALIVMLLGLILRGVAFEFRYKTQRMRWIWDLSFAGGRCREPRRRIFGPASRRRAAHSQGRGRCRKGPQTASASRLHRRNIGHS